MSQKGYRIAIVKYTDHASLNRIEKGAKMICEQLSTKYGIPLDYEGLVFDGQADMERMEKIGNQLAKEKVDLVISIATPPTVAMKKVLEENHITMLFRAVSDPISAKVINSFEHPGEYITGTSDSLDGKELADVLLQVLPNVKKVGLLYSKEEFSSKNPIQEAKEYFDSKQIAWVEETPNKKEDVKEATQKLIEAGVEAVLTPTDNIIMSAEMEISPILTNAGIPQFTGSHAFTINGAFMGLGSIYKDGDEEFKELLERVLFGKEKPNDIPVIRSPHTFAAINNQVCEALGYNHETLEKEIGALGKRVLFLDSQQEFDEDSDL